MENMAPERDLIARFYLFVIFILLGIATGLIYSQYGWGLGVIVLGILTVVALWGFISGSSRVRHIIATLLSCSLA